MQDLDVLCVGRLAPAVGLRSLLPASRKAFREGTLMGPSLLIYNVNDRGHERFRDERLLQGISIATAEESLL